MPVGLFLPVVCVGAMLAGEVLFYEERIHSQLRVHLICDESHLCHLLHHNGIVHGLFGSLAPAERPMVFHEHARSMNRIEADKALYDYISCLEFIVTFDFGGSHIACARNGIVEIVGVSSADIGQIDSCFRPCCCISGVSVHHTANFGKSTV